MTPEQKRHLRSVYIAIKEAYIAGVYAAEIKKVGQLARQGTSLKQTATLNKRTRPYDKDELRNVLSDDIFFPEQP